MPRRLTSFAFPAALVALLLAQITAASPAFAAAGTWLDQEQARLRLISASDSTGRDGSLALGLHVELQPGWKIYWRSPGDAGFPPNLDWSGSENLASTEMAWPVPERFSLFGLETFGYGEEVVLPIAARLAQPGAPAKLRAEVTYLICEEICIPLQGTLGLDLPAGDGGRGLEALLIDQYASLVPGDGGSAGLSLEQTHLSGPAEAPSLEVVARATQAMTAPDVIVEAPPGFTFGKPEVELEDGGRLAVLTLEGQRNARAEGVLEGKRLTLTLFDGRRGLEAEVIARYPSGTSAAAAMPSAATAGGDTSLLVILGLALLGGLILNLMPCVLPVLSIKLLSAVSHGGRASGPVRVSFLASAAGILFSFMVLAGIAIALKAAGMAAGWGIQFQQPVFLAVMAVVVTLFACNLFGLFEIALPAWLGGVAGGSGAAEHSLSGHFMTGALATILATPCSAPFLGTAVGFALARGVPEILLVFAALGLGLALPYLLVAAVPTLATRLPRPGPWMITLRRILGLALAGTAVWLLSVLAVQVGLTAALVAGGLLVALGLLLGLGRRLPRPTLAAAAAVMVLATVASPIGLAGPAPAEKAATESWEPFDRARIDRLVAEGSVVFVDVTADWCITCQVNKALVIDSDTVSARLGDGTVVAMRGDWTLPSDAISDYLASFGRYGIPFNAVYGPGLPDGEALPELLTVEAVLDAIERAGGAAEKAPELADRGE
ncbi:MAG: thioredoxin family protein [Kiloniellales bacterium]|nr:thioredoxin family protein [Kiloniellales bacterium]